MNAGKSLFFQILLVLILALNGCKGERAKAKSLRGGAGVESVSLMQDRIPYSRNDPDWLKVAWQKFISNGRYRIPDKSAFHIPKSEARDRYAELDIEDAISEPYGIRDINGDGHFPDLVVIVEELGRADPQRFSIVIFNAPSDDKSIPEPIWLVQNEDLSMTILDWWSGGLTLRKYLNDGTTDGCYVNWNKSQKKYFCEKAYHGS